MSRCLVVEDDTSIANLIRLYLRREGHNVDIVGNGSSAFQRLSTSTDAFDLVVLDLMLPGLDGRGLCRRIRETSTIPIVMLTALDDDRDKIEGLDLGADDYLTKPFNPDELVARVRAVLRRTRGSKASASPRTELRFGNLVIDERSRTVTIEGSAKPLRAKEFDLLWVLAANEGIVLSRDQLLQLVWGGEFDGDTRTVDVHVSRLRDHLHHAGATVKIETLRSVGYRLSTR